MKNQFVLILGILGLGFLVVFGIFTSEKQDLVFDGNGNSVFFDFDDDTFVNAITYLIQQGLIQV